MIILIAVVRETLTYISKELKLASVPITNNSTCLRKESEAQSDAAGLAE